MASLREQLKELENPQPSFADPEDDYESLTSAKLSKKDSDIQSAEPNNRFGSIRSRVSTLEQDEKYHGLKVSRNDIADDISAGLDVSEDDGDDDSVASHILLEEDGDGMLGMDLFTQLFVITNSCSISGEMIERSAIQILFCDGIQNCAVINGIFRNFIHFKALKMERPHELHDPCQALLWTCWRGARPRPRAGQTFQSGS